jgi:DNA (cytosine-5)-methyltransferase 1
VNVIATVVIKYLDETPVPKVNKRVLSFQIADAVWAWLAEGDLSGKRGVVMPRAGDVTAGQRVIDGMAPTFGSLFAGIGGIDLGLERAGWLCQWQVEIDPFCQSVLAAHWPDVPRYSDIKRLRLDDLPAVDLVAGGFPCQPVSVAGKRLAQDDPRWLWPWFASVIDHLQPRFVLIENVPGLRTAGLRDVLADLASLGFDAEWSPLSACALGAPHTRSRLLIVANANGAGSQGRRPERGLGEGGGEVEAARSDWWTAEPDMDRVADGVPDRVDRLRSLGNAVVPQTVEHIGRRLMAVA